MNVLITGATGYIGFNVAQAFRRAGHSVIGMDISILYLPLNQALQSMGPNAEAVALDLELDSGKAQRLLGWKARHIGFIPEAEICFASWKAWRFAGEVIHAGH